MNTTNVPTSLPIKCCDADHKLIVEWMAKQPYHSLDDCINRKVRWLFQICDDGITSNIKVSDQVTKEVFVVPTDHSNF